MLNRIICSLVSRSASTSHSLRELFYHGKPEEVLKQYNSQQPSLFSVPIQTYCIIFKAFILTKKWSEGHQLYTQIKANTKFSNDERLKIASKLRNNISFIIYIFRLF
jgi:hypothetical protein